MNIDRDLITRALAKAGQEPITQDDIDKESARWRLIKAIYLPTMLETLSKTSWTCCKKKARMEAYDGDNLSIYDFAYRLPTDCSKPEELTDNAEFDVEGRILYTDQENPVLTYITNGYVGKRFELPENQPTQDNFSNNVWYKLVDGEYVLATEWEDEVTFYRYSTDDFPSYDDLVLEPLLVEYLETRIASKIVLKITGDQNLYNLLYNEALLMERQAVDATIAHSHSREKGEEWWAVQLGLEA